MFRNLNNFNEDFASVALSAEVFAWLPFAVESRVPSSAADEVEKVELERADCSDCKKCRYSHLSQDPLNNPEGSIGHFRMIFIRNQKNL